VVKPKILEFITLVRVRGGAFSCDTEL